MFICCVKKNPAKFFILDVQEEVINEYNIISEAGRKTNINFRNISEVCKGNRKTAGGFMWEYACI